ncbi:MAG: ribosomal protein S18-alanine N-acetyltransferase [Carnobacterium inhibens]|uniref:[Ribosomal protein bS18]-alanine N-acetyltransferase n=1 Tax=Carnobacterium inhibens TaxID=147709 RepID=A0ABR7T898_9LACT|nr:MULTISPECIES: ribosomal protein S18-alanine N-acetyltransferase [Carnobacterium]MBC9824315.1 ribosomal-protein-alanine N-acetyltransferase [Carnobacterium inhibens]MDN5371256.1 [ribosomal protein S18]-alanine N-acetyltransferase [Carnobacterium sp.]
MENPKIVFLFKQSAIVTENELFQLAEDSYVNGSPWSIEMYKQELTGTHNEYAIALYEGEKVGFIGYTMLFDEAEITTFGIVSAYKNQGIGQLFLRSFIDYLKENEIKTVFLEVREQNKSAIVVYKKIGFETIATRKNYYHDPIENALIMQLSIK